MGDKLVILGAQWGDEGKGKVVDLLSESYGAVVRYQGGSNAGHTVVVGEEKFVLHLLPTGILHPHTIGVIAQGMVVDLEVLDRELRALEERGMDYEGRVLISDRAHLVMPYHRVLDELLERKGGIGTTLRGIGPAYMFKYGRKGIRVSDLEDEVRLRSLVEDNVLLIKEMWGQDIPVEPILSRTLSLYEKYRHLVGDAFRFLSSFGGSVLFEGAQGTMLDVDMGTYPFVTSSNSSALGLSSGTGLSPRYFKSATFLGVAKAYTTRVGGGPFPTEIQGEEGKRLRDLGGEYGSTTGRPRRCGWLDLVALKYATEVNGFDGLILTKLDVLDTFEEIKVCVAYEIEGERVERFPASLSLLAKVKPVYETVKGWLTSTKGIKDVKDLPVGARRYVSLIEDFTGVPVLMLSTGPRREEFVWLREIPQTKVSSL